MDKTTLARDVFNHLLPCLSGNSRARVKVGLEGASATVAQAREHLLGQLGVRSAEGLLAKGGWGVAENAVAEEA